MDIQSIKKAIELLAAKASLNASLADKELIAVLASKANEELDKPVRLVIIRDSDNVDALTGYGDAPITIVTDIEVEEGWEENVDDAMENEIDPAELDRENYGISIVELAIYPLSHLPNNLEYATGIPRK